jgi:hypothetical protein
MVPLLSVAHRCPPSAVYATHTACDSHLPSSPWMCWVSFLGCRTSGHQDNGLKQQECAPPSRSLKPRCQRGSVRLCVESFFASLLLLVARVPWLMAESLQSLPLTPLPLDLCLDKCLQFSLLRTPDIEFRGHPNSVSLCFG